MKRIITIQADETIYNKLLKESKEKMLSMSALIRLIILEYFNAKETK